MNAQMFRSTLTLALVAVGATAAAQSVESSLALDDAYHKAAHTLETIRGTLSVAAL